MKNQDKLKEEIINIIENWAHPTVEDGINYYSFDYQDIKDIAETISKNYHIKSKQS